MKPFLARVVALSVAFAPVAHANPTGPGVAAGSASFSAQGNTLNVTHAAGTQGRGDGRMHASLAWLF